MNAPDATRRRNPWWIPPFLGRVPDSVDPSLVRLLGAVTLLVVFENYDQAMLTQALKHIAEDLGVPESDLGSLLGWVRFGAVPAFFLIPFADRFGRRRLFLISIAGMSAGTVLTAFTTGVTQFVVLQMIARLFMVTGAATVFVIITEELPAQHRGWGIGIVGAVGAFGVGLAAILFSLIEWLPFGWRAMYFIGAVPLLMLPGLRREVRETDRFTRSRDLRPGAETEPLWRPLVALFRTHPTRALAVGVVGAAASGGHAGAYNFSAFFVQDVHGWAPAYYSVMLIVVGAAGIIGYPYAGRFADRYGRRVAGFLFYAAFPLLAFGFYRGPSWLLPFAWVPLVFSLTGGLTIARAISTELFATEFRGTASGWLQLTETLGAGGALLLISWLTPVSESSVPAVTGVACLTLVAALVVTQLPETSQRELEEISREP